MDLQEHMINWWVSMWVLCSAFLFSISLVLSNSFVVFFLFVRWPFSLGGSWLLVLGPRRIFAVRCASYRPRDDRLVPRVGAVLPTLLFHPAAAALLPLWFPLRGVAARWLASPYEVWFMPFKLPSWSVSLVVDYICSSVLHCIVLSLRLAAGFTTTITHYSGAT